VKAGAYDYHGNDAEIGWQRRDAGVTVYTLKEVAMSGMRAAKDDRLVQGAIVLEAAVLKVRAPDADVSRLICRQPSNCKKVAPRTANPDSR
jgi:hypothetical protein